MMAIALTVNNLEKKMNHLPPHDLFKRVLGWEVFFAVVPVVRPKMQC
jgi:hypothetical protein